jgi:hypothetical protein
MLSRKTFYTVTLAVAVVGVAGGLVLGDHLIHRTVTSTEAAWAEIYKAPTEMARRVDAVVLAKAVSVAPGRVAYSDNGEDALPFEVFEFEVVKPVKGLQGVSSVFVERAGGIAPDGSSVVFDMDGGAFELGQTYLLFLKRQPDTGLFYQVNSQGRFRVANDRLWSTETDDPVAKAFHGRTLGQGIAMVREDLRGDRPVVQ